MMPLQRTKLSFLWPEMLWSATVLPILVVLYRWLMRRRRPSLSFSSLGLVREAMRTAPAWRRVLPPALMLIAFALMVVAAARPTASVPLPVNRQTVMLVMDVSGSMNASDVRPNRLTASQVAAQQFVEQLPSGTRIGVVAYGGSAHLVQPPTLDRADVNAAIRRFQLQPGTAIGSGLVVALATLFPEAGYDVLRLDKRGGRSLNEGPPRVREPAVRPGSDTSTAIVLLTDGQNTTGPDPMQIAQLAADRGIRIFTVGFGTPEGAVVEFSGWRMKVYLDEETLMQIADLTHGQYFAAASGAELGAVYEALKSRLAVEYQSTEITVLFANAAALLMLLSAALSVWWFARVL